MTSKDFVLCLLYELRESGKAKAKSDAGDTGEEDFGSTMELRRNSRIANLVRFNFAS
jgi:hypothetical protein